MQHFMMMVGLPGSGKSSWTDTYKNEYNWVIHSSDDIREELFGSAEIQGDNKILFDTLHKRVFEDLKKGKHVIYDACNTDYKKRRDFVYQVKKLNPLIHKQCIFIATPYKDCLTQNTFRKRIVPEYVIERMYKNIYIPQYYEGWDEITFWFTNNKIYSLGDLFKKLDKFNQDNPHHTLTVGNHCRKTCNNLPEDNYVLGVAGLLHDIGKPFTKTFKNMKGEKTDHAHYYQHHLVSAYDSLFYYEVENTEFLLKLTNYIQWHMQPFFMDNEKTRNKYKNLWGDEDYNNILLLHKADKAAK